MIWGFVLFLMVIYMVYSLHIIKNQLDSIQRKLEIYEDKMPHVTNEEIERELEEELIRSKGE